MEGEEEIAPGQPLQETKQAVTNATVETAKAIEAAPSDKLELALRDIHASLKSIEAKLDTPATAEKKADAATTEVGQVPVQAADPAVQIPEKEIRHVRRYGFKKVKK